MEQFQVRDGVLIRCECEQEIVEIPEGVEEIGSGAFHTYAPIREIICPHSLRKVGRKAFLCSHNLEIINLPDGIEIGEGAFEGCDNLKKISAKDNILLDKVEDCIFSGCLKLQTKIVVDPKAKEIGAEAFYGCEALRTIQLPDNISVGEGAFYSCVNLERISDSDEILLSEICEGAFSYCEKLKTEITLNEEVCKVGNEAFSDCTNLKRINLPNGIEIGNKAFVRCEKLEELSKSGSVYIKSIGESAFRDCLKLKTKMTIDSSVIEIGDLTFFSCENLKTIHLPNKVKVGEYAFSGCNKLESISDSNQISLLEIGREAFSYCERLKTDIYVGKMIEKINEGTFRECKNISRVILLDGIEIGEDAFCECKKIQSISDKEKIVLKNIELRAFCSCFKLETDIVVDMSVMAINNYAFYDCKNIKRIDLPDGIFIKERSFYNCKKLESISKEKKISLSGIGQYAFAYCEKMATEIFVMDQVKKIGENAFYECRMLKLIHIPAQTKFHKNYFMGCNNLKQECLEKKQERKFLEKQKGIQKENGLEKNTPFVIENHILKEYRGELGVVYVPEEVTEIGDGAFRWDDNVTEIYFEGKITRIGKEAFMGCEKLKRINLPHKIVIGKEAFEDCTALETITDDLVYTLGETGEDAFCGCENLHNDIEIAEGTIELKDGVFNLCEKIKKIYIPDSLRMIGSDSFYEVETFICKRNVGMYLELQDMGFQCVMKEWEGRKILKNIELVEAMQEENDDSRPQWKSIFPESVYTVEEQWLYGIHPDDEMYKKLLELEVIRKFSGRWKV